MNRNIANKQITTKNGDTKSHQAYAMEYSRLKEAKKLCEKSGNCFEYNKIGGNDRFVEVENLVQSERKKDKLSNINWSKLDTIKIENKIILLIKIV